MNKVTCAFGCGLTYASIDAMKKHARKQHPEWAEANLNDGRRKFAKSTDCSDGSDEELYAASLPLIGKEIATWTYETIYRSLPNLVPALLDHVNVEERVYYSEGDARNPYLNVILANEYGKSQLLKGRLVFWCTALPKYTKVFRDKVQESERLRMLKNYRDKFEDMFRCEQKRAKLMRFLDEQD